MNLLLNLMNNLTSIHNSSSPHLVMITATFYCSKKLRKLHLFLTKLAFMRTFDCERLDTTYFCLRGLGHESQDFPHFHL